MAKPLPRKAGKTKKPIEQPNLAVPQTVRRKYTMPIIGIVFGILVLAAAGLFAYAQATNSHIVLGVSISGIRVSGLSKERAQATLATEVQSYQEQGVTVSYGNVSQTIPLQQLGVRFNVAGTIHDAYAVGRSTRLEQWLLHAFRKSSINIPLRAAVDQAIFQNYVTEFRGIRSTPKTEPSLAIADGTVSIVPGQDGVAVTTTATPDAVRAAVSRLQTVHITFQSATEHPKLNDEDLNEAKTAAETMMSGPLTLTFGNRRFVVGKDELQHWVQYSFDPTKIVSDPREGVVLSVNHDLAAAYLSSLNDVIGVPAKPTFGFDAEVLGEYAYKNSQGKAVNIDDALAKIPPAIQDASPRSVELVVSPSDPPIEKLTAVAPRPTGKVIEVDLSRQALLAFEDGKLKFFTRVSTGLPSHATPTGEWKIYNKTTIQRMVGQGYNLPNVKWVMAYNGDYTLHTAYWHNDFGVPKSHGCTNMAEADAKWLFDWAEIGTPVVIQESSI